MLPQDPIMLLSVLNMKLRDSYGSFDALCEDMEIGEAKREEIVKKLADAGFSYDDERNAFV
ncbi:MAG: DUF4250 domain-containing protein [Butyrivibrio sp.]|nr:DUF4250 domain-containing protein [Butyrivibrio sp.]